MIRESEKRERDKRESEKRESEKRDRDKRESPDRRDTRDLVKIDSDKVSSDVGLYNENIKNRLSQYRRKYEIYSRDHERISMDIRKQQSIILILHIF